MRLPINRPRRPARINGPRPMKPQLGRQVPPQEFELKQNGLWRFKAVESLINRYDPAGSLTRAGFELLQKEGVRVLDYLLVEMVKNGRIRRYDIHNFCGQFHDECMVTIHPVVKPRAERKRAAAS